LQYSLVVSQAARLTRRPKSRPSRLHLSPFTWGGLGTGAGHVALHWRKQLLVLQSLHLRVQGSSTARHGSHDVCWRPGGASLQGLRSAVGCGLSKSAGRLGVCCCHQLPHSCQLHELCTRG
jgi:hypothetical protein